MPSRPACNLPSCGPVLSAGARVGLVATILFFGCESLQTATANGETRTISLHNLHTKEDISVTFKRDGHYDEAALKKLSWFLRDWRREQQTSIDPQLIDLLWEVYREVEAKQPIQVICGYRAPQTNMMLRRRSRGVARNSQHTVGKAIDFAIPGVPLEKLRIAGLRLQRGGVGFYPTSGSPFVHMDVGGVRHWPRLTREQLVKVFPNGRTVHIPSDGHPLPGYALALADIGRHGSSPSAMSLAAAKNDGFIDETGHDTGSRRPSLLARIFGSANDESDDTDAASASTPAAGSKTQVAQIAPVPLPKLRPASAPTLVAAAKPVANPIPRPAPAPVVVASAESAAKQQATASKTVSPQRRLSPNEIINFRGYWVAMAEGFPIAKSAAVAAHETTASIPRRVASADGSESPALTLAYAKAQALDVRFDEPRSPRRSLIMRSAEAATSIAAKATSAPAAQAVYSLRRYNPWIAAVAMTPSVRYYLTATQYGERDFLSLRPYLSKPNLAVAMAFSPDPSPGLTADRFDGRAIVFVGTVVFAAKATVLTHTAIAFAGDRFLVMP